MEVYKRIARRAKLLKMETEEGNHPAILNFVGVEWHVGRIRINHSRSPARESLQKINVMISPGCESRQGALGCCQKYTLNIPRFNEGIFHYSKASAVKDSFYRSWGLCNKIQPITEVFITGVSRKILSAWDTRRSETLMTNTQSKVRWH